MTADELEVFSMLLLSLNRKKYPLKVLNLDNCDLTDEKLVRLLFISFPKVAFTLGQNTPRKMVVILAKKNIFLLIK